MLKEGAKYAAKEYLPPPSKMHGPTFHLTSRKYVMYDQLSYEDE